MKREPYLLDGLVVGEELPQSSIADDEKLVIVAQRNSRGVGVRNDVRVEIGAAQLPRVLRRPSNFVVLWAKECVLAFRVNSTCEVCGRCDLARDYLKALWFLGAIALFCLTTNARPQLP